MILGFFAPRSTRDDKSMSPDIPAIDGSITRTMKSKIQKCI